MTADKPTPPELTPKQKRDAYGCLAILAVGITLFFGSCVYNMGYPWTCADAQTYFRESKDNYNVAFEKGDDLGMSVYREKAAKAHQAIYAKCPPGQRFTD